MTKETFTQRILIPDENKWLYNEKEKVISDKVYLGKEADEADWVEITTVEKERLEAEWSGDTNAD